MSAGIPSIVRYVFRWHSRPDACPRCQSLNGMEWRGQDLFAPRLVDPVQGMIWDLDADRSLLHGDSGTCRCFLEVQVEVIELTKLEGFAEVKRMAEGMTS